MQRPSSNVWAVLSCEEHPPVGIRSVANTVKLAMQGGLGPAPTVAIPDNA